MRNTLASVAIVLLAVALATPAWAQADPQLTISAAKPTVSSGPNETLEVRFTVRNTGQTGGSVALSLPHVAGWRLHLGEPSFTLASQGQKEVVVQVEPTGMAKNASMELRGQITESLPSGRQSLPATSRVELVYVAPVPPPPPVPPEAFNWQPYGAVAGILLIGLLVFQNGSVGLEPSSSRIEVTPAGSGYVRVTVRNRWGPTRRVSIRVRDTPSPAVAAFSIMHVRLRRGESVSVPLMVKAPVEMPDGEKSISIQARSGYFGPWLSRRRIQLTFRSPVEPDAPLEKLAPIILQN